MTVEVTRACPEHAERIGLIRVAAWQAAYKDFMPQDFLDGLDPLQGSGKLAGRLPSFTSEFTMNVALAGTDCVGFSSAGTPRYQTGGRTMELYALYVDPELWGRGVGQALLRRAIADARHLEMERIELWCIKENDQARRFYETAGFESSCDERTTDALTGSPLTEVKYHIDLV